MDCTMRTRRACPCTRGRPRVHTWPAAPSMDALDSDCARQWHRAGGHALAHAPALADASRATFALLQSAASLDAAAESTRVRLRVVNASSSANEPAKRTRPNVPTRSAAADEEDDVSDGSAVQGDLIDKNVRPGKARVPIRLADAAEQRAPDGSLRLIEGDVLSADECSLLIASGLVAMAGAFTRCGQTTLGLSPALAGRMTAPAAEASAGREA